MFVLFDNISGSPYRYRINGVYSQEPKFWTHETQIGVEYPDSEYTDVVVNTPDGPMPFLNALMQRSGAFILDVTTGDILHDDEWRDAI